MREIINRLYTFHAKAGEPEFERTLERWLPMARRWDVPKLANGLLASSESSVASGKGVIDNEA